MTTNLLSNQNTKLKKDGIFHFSIPAFRSQFGFVTCPGAAKCAVGCYARQGFHAMSWVKHKKERNFAATLRMDFAEMITTEIKKRKVKILRIHEAGDFYSEEYLLKWFSICWENPEVKFYAYTKMLPMFKQLDKMPANFTVIYSYGGKWDSLIGKRDHHAKVFKTKEALKKSGYVDASKSDLVAIKNIKVGLCYHGGKNLNWGEA